MAAHPRLADGIERVQGPGRAGTRPWSEAEDAALLRAVTACGHGNWSRVSEHLAPAFKRNGKQCRERFINHIDPALTHGPWTVADDLDLIAVVREVRGTRIE